MASPVYRGLVAILLLTVDCALSYLMPLDAAQCNVACLSKDATTPVKIQRFYECWNACSQLPSGDICNQSSKCNLGCRLACRFYSKGVDQFIDSRIVSSRNLSPHSPIKLTLTDSNVLLDWSLKTEGSPSIYIILKHSDGRWTSVTQTAKTNCSLKKEDVGSYLKLFAVDQAGFLWESSVVTDLQNSTWSELLVSWTPSLIYFRNGGGDKGAEATIHWPTFEKSKKCEVIWKVMNKNIEITGHLYSEGNVASLTLWTNSIYSVEIKCYDSDRLLCAYSDPLTLDTYGIGAKEKNCSIGFHSLSFILFSCCFVVVGVLISIFASGCYCKQKCRNDQKIVETASLPHILISDKKGKDFPNSMPLPYGVTLPTADCKIDLPSTQTPSCFHRLLYRTR